jgi:hypothetical protein
MHSDDMGYIMHTTRDLGEVEALPYDICCAGAGD